MKLQAQVIMNVALGLSLGFVSTGCQMTGNKSKKPLENRSAATTPVQPDWTHVLQEEDMPTLPKDEVREEPVSTPVAKRVEEVAHRDPCPGCGMG
jgi:hypothetical protein